MLNRHALLLFAVALIGVPASGQFVISAHSGLVEYFEGQVFINTQPLAPNRGRFPEIGDNAVLRTENGRAEVLLTPGVYVRLDGHSAIHMISSRLIDTRIAFLSGSAIVESTDVQPDNSVVLIYGARQIRLLKRGSYRLDSAPASLRVGSGDVELSIDGNTTVIGEARRFSFLSNTVTAALPDSMDAFDRWAERRSQTVGGQTAANSNTAAAPPKSRTARAFPRVRAPLPRRTW
jgi:hypothetical protein